MKCAFLDTSALVALYDKTDENHAGALVLMETVKREKIGLVMSDYILDEAVTTALMRIGHEAAVRVGEFILGSSVVRLVWLDERIKRAAWEYFKLHSDKKYSFTDCSSFVLMKELKVTKCLSFDGHFQQAGFSVLAKLGRS
jgi:predicted nucleic acid-binding protein